MPPKEDSVTIPRWFVQLLTWSIGLMVAVAMAAVPWAWSLDRNVTQIRSNLDAIERVNGVEQVEIKRRIEALEKVVEWLRSKTSG